MCPKCSFNNPAEELICLQCSTPLRSLLGFGTILGQRYKLARVLGCGAMGAVYLAEDQRLAGRRCAVKENLPDSRTPVNIQNQSREQFLAEANILGRLDHPNLPKVSDYFIENSREYLVMDFVEGEDLESRLHRLKRPLDENDVLIWADQVLDALAYLHSQRPRPIIHRDIKPANLRIDAHNRVKLVDFGLVKLYDADNPETKSGLRGIGTPAYAPLEQFAGSDEHTDNRSDIYSLGATLYHLLTHIPPVEVHRRLLKHDRLLPPREVNPDLSANIEQVILRAIEIYPNDRFQSAEEMRQALKAPVSSPYSPPAGAGPAPVKTHAPKNTKGLWLFGLVGFLVILLVLSGLFWALFGLDRGVPPADDRPVAAIAPTRTLAATSTPAATPSPTRVVEAMTATSELALAAVTTTTPTLSPTSPTIISPTSSPTITRVEQLPRGILPGSLVGTIAYPVFNGTSYDIYFGQADGSGTRFFQAQASQPAFSPDGSRIALHSWSLDKRGLMTADISGANGILITNFVEDQLPTWSPDGSQITLLSRRSGSRKSELIRVNSFEEISQGTLLGEGEYPTLGSTGQLVFKGWGNTGTGLRLSSPDLSAIQPVTDNDQDTAPALSPDGQQLVFMSRRTGNWEIFLADADGSNLQQLTEDPAQDGLPTWSPDGKVIAFVSNRGNQWAIWAMTPAGSDKQLLFEIQGSPDGFVSSDTYASRGWAEERISWTR
jgi:serine/threonine-protein kinase